MSDLINKQEVFNVIKKIGLNVMSYTNFQKLWHSIEVLPSAEPERKWIPFKAREMTEEEKENHPEFDSMMDCPLPDDYEDILVSDGETVWADTFYNDDFCTLDSGHDLIGCAWMRYPKPWRGEK